MEDDREEGTFHDDEPGNRGGYDDPSEGGGSRGGHDDESSGAHDDGSSFDDVDEDDTDD